MSVHDQSCACEPAKKRGGLKAPHRPFRTSSVVGPGPSGTRCRPVKSTGWPPTHAASAKSAAPMNTAGSVTCCAGTSTRYQTGVPSPEPGTSAFAGNHPSARGSTPRWYSTPSRLRIASVEPHPARSTTTTTTHSRMRASSPAGRRGGSARELEGPTRYRRPVSYRPRWWIPQATLDGARLEASFAAQLPTTAVKLEAGAEGAVEVAFSTQGGSEPDCWAVLDVRQGTPEPGETTVTSFEALEREIPLFEDEGEDDEVFTTPWVRALAGDPRSTQVLVGGDGPWLVSVGNGEPHAHLRLVPRDAWRARIEGAPKPADASLEEDPGVRRIRLRDGAGVICGAPSLLFARSAQGGFAEVITGLPDGLDLVDAVSFHDEWWVTTRTGEVWRSRAGTAERKLVGAEVHTRSLESRLDVRRFGGGLVFAQGLSELSLWDGETLRSANVPPMRNAADAAPGLCWLATPTATELWAAGPDRLLVGDGRQWFEAELPGARLWIHGLCEEPSGGVWAVARDLARRRDVLLRATVARGVELIDGVAFVDPEEGTPLSLEDPSPHRGGLLAIAETRFVAWVPPSVGTSLSLRLRWEEDDVRFARDRALCAAIDTVVASLGGWFVG